jgi:RNA polymerase sigma-70 factor (ECF subfamily)
MTEAELAKLYVRYGYVVFRRCLLYLGDAEAAQRAVQEIFVRVVRGWDAFCQDPQPHRALCRSADQWCVEQLHAARRATNAATPPAEHTASASESETTTGNDDHAALLSMRRLAQELDPDTFRLAVLYFTDELSEEELARELGVSRRSVKKREQQLLERARGLLKVESLA